MIQLSARQADAGPIPVSIQNRWTSLAVQETSSFADQTATYRELIETYLDRYSQFDSGCPDILRQAVRYSLLAPGKRLRPMLALMACEACGCQKEKAIPAACAVEMVHAYSLIHDDLPAMDDDDLRRGLPTCHVKFGEANAILAGDALLARAFEVLARYVQPSELAGPCCLLLAEAAGACQLVGGQFDDLAAERRFEGDLTATSTKRDIAPGSLEEMEAIHRRKTGAMLEVSLALGGTAAAASAEQLGALRTYGRSLGLAFQVVDDLLDFEGDEEQLGKRVGKDADHGKLTYPALLGVEASRNRATELVEEACEAVALFDDRSAQLVQLARYVLERRR